MSFASNGAEDSGTSSLEEEDTSAAPSSFSAKTATFGSETLSTKDAPAPSVLSVMLLEEFCAVASISCLRNSVFRASALSL